MNYEFRDPSLEISLTNEPLERPGFAKFSEVTSQTNSFVNPDAFRYGTSLTVGLSLFASVFLVFPLIERVTNAKQVQIMTGMPVAISSMRFPLFLEMCNYIGHET